MRIFLLTLTLCSVSLITPLFAQEFSGGFRAGLNFISFDGDPEMSADGSITFEEFKRTTGFHVGATFALAFTDLVGVKADLMYSQKGGERRFTNTPSFFYLYSGPEDSEGEVNFGTLNSEIDVVNSYIDIPVLAYYRIGIFELEAGASMGFMVNSEVSGGKTYTNTRFGGGDNPIILNVDGRYFSDEAAGAGIISLSSTPLPSTSVLPPEVISAYYNNSSNDPLYRRFDFGLIGGLNVFLNNGLFIGGRYQYGLTDLTRPENDLRRANEDQIGGREYNADDKDYSRSFQASIGFRF
ncbi:porin family protein [Neolewinella persica]|uniref:porin family protein n=1 Tax=Neolewinella persica TaxID=70998 RepID=UPI00039EDF1F|nr:porin family protein [Neolewinella persica]